MAFDSKMVNNFDTKTYINLDFINTYAIEMKIGDFDSLLDSFYAL